MSAHPPAEQERSGFDSASAFLQLCSPALADSLSILKKSKKQYLRKRRRRERYKALRTARERQSVSKAPKTRPEAGGGPSDVSSTPAAAQPRFSARPMTASVSTMLYFPSASFRARCSRQAAPEPARCLPPASRSS